MIAIVGRLGSGPASEIARRAAAGGATVELVATVEPGAAGDERLARLAGAGIGHAAVLRTPAERLEPADLELALRYLPDVSVVVLADPSEDLRDPAAAAAAWSSAALVVIGPAGSPAWPRTIALEGPAKDRDGSFAGVVANLAVRLDRGEPDAVAWSATAAALGLERVAPPGGR